MKQSQLYYPLWLRYLKVITIQMKNASTGTKEINLSKAEFEALGNRAVSDYRFNLEIEYGRVTNDISGTAVARDLFSILQQDPIAKRLLSSNHYKFSLGKAFILKISVFK